MTKKSPCSQHSSCMCIFPRECHIQRREKGAGKLRSQPQQSRNDRARAQTKREVRQEKETAAETSQSQKERKKERNNETGKGWGTVRKMPRKSKRSVRAGLSHLALSCRRDRTSPWWFWKVCDFDVTGSFDVISPDHFVRGFYNSSFRRCGLNFLVLQKDNKILVHNLSIHEKLEQLTHWNILKKWGKDFTFGSGCTVHTRINRLWSPLAYGLGGNIFSLTP